MAGVAIGHLGRRGGTGRRAPNLTPMVDVVLCVLVFFMLGSVFAGPELYLAAGQRVRDSEELPSTSPADFRFDVRLDLRPDGTTAVSTDSPRFARGLTVGRPDAAPDAAARRAEAARNDAIATALADLRSAGLSDSATVVIRPHGDVPYADFIRVYDACVKARLPKVALAPAR